MRNSLLILMFTCACNNIQAQVNIITTICGGTQGYCGDQGSATNACLDAPQLICLDNYDHLYIADGNNNRIRKIDFATGIITTVVGKGTVPGKYSGDGGAATNAELSIPVAVITDSEGNIYLSDGLNYRIRKVDITTGIITTVAGIGTKGDFGDGGLATNAKIGGVSGLYVSKHGDIIFTDLDNNKVKKVDGSTHVITTIAGNGSSGYSGDNGLAANAILAGPGQPFVDINDNIFFTDADNNVIRKISVSTNIITTIAGIGAAGYSGDGGPATAAKFKQIYGMFIDKGNNIFIGDWGNGSIRRIDGNTGIITTVAGSGVQGYSSGDGGPATAALMAPVSAVVDRHGRVYISDYSSNRIRMVYDSTQHYTEVKTVTKRNIKIYPNPATNELTIEGAEGSEVSVWNMVGQSFDKLRMTKNKQEIDVSKLVPGMYMLQIVNSSGKEVRRFVKE